MLNVREALLTGLTVLALLGLIFADARAAITNLVPNPSFEEGRTEPTGWSAFSLAGHAWEYDGVDGERCLSVAGLGEDTSWWAPKGVLSLDANRLYYLSYWVRRTPQTTGGAVIAGLQRVNRDARAGTDWSKRGFYFRTPDAVVSSASFRLGQWHLNGTVFFDDVRLAPAVRVLRRPGELNIQLGEGESIVEGRYEASHRLSGPGSTDFRCLDHFTAHFNTNRWVFDGEQQVTYRHAVGRLRHAEPEVEVGVNWHVRGSVLIQASADGKRWVPLGEIDSVKIAACPVPRELLPLRELWVRLRSTPGAELQVNRYVYRCALPEAESVSRMTGGTHYVTLLRTSDDLEVEIQGLGDLRPGADNAAELVIRNHGPRRSIRARLTVGRHGAVADESETRSSLSTDGTRRIFLPYLLDSSGSHHIKLECSELLAEELLWAAESDVTISPLYDPRGGHLLRKSADLAIWWCEPERKVTRQRPVPAARSAALRIEAAANEYEAAQLVLTPSTTLKGCRLTASDLIGDSGARVPADEVEIRTVEYVFVAEPTDDLGAVDEWPDPLPVHDAPVDLAAGRNQPFWVSVHVPSGTPAGDYRGHLTLRTDSDSYHVPIVVHVWDFELPKETHLRTGFGLSRWLIPRYHNLTSEEELRQVHRLYLRDFAEHRVAPYTFGRPIHVEWEKGAHGYLEPKFDFSEFDEDARFALDELGFNCFRLDLQGLGGGTYHSRRPGRILDLEQGTPDYEAAFARYAQAVQAYLEQRGWLDKAYVYWFDEPDEKDYEFVREGMELIHRAAPKLTRMLTEHPDSRLYDAVDLWCTPTFALTPTTLWTRQTAHDEFWWYLCTAPKAPYFTLFLDHYGTELRLWSWETWKYGLDGLLVWQTMYWTSGNAYPGDEVQNPWQDAMSWTSGYGLEPGERRPWGNGDGRFLYPPNRAPGVNDTKYLEGPVPSIRWELLRDGIEDYEYFWLLKQHVDRLKEAGVDPSIYEEAETLLQVPADVCSSLIDFTTTPEPIYAHRAKLAAAIERLRRNDSSNP